ncbi:MAG: S8 family peptidase [Eubacteriales bacterium]|nr:S8 family peptidase [Eubacteriales bacterium]MDD4389366.1 S8 family peptidase [Eubacteriales bacterium]
MTIPYIVFSKRSCGELRSCIVENYGLIRHEYPFINAMCIEVPEEKVARIKKHRLVSMVLRDGVVKKMSTSDSAYAAHLPIAIPFSATGGYGVTIAIIDTGISPHYDFLKPHCRLFAFKDVISNEVLPYDDDGHGTHVAGIAAGNGHSCNGHIKGTAPLANIVAVKALDETGSGTSSDILAAMQWISDNKERYNIRVLNLSFGVPSEEEDAPDPLVVGTTALVRQGITVIAAAGNSGPKSRTISSPGINPLIVTVGAYGPNGIADFSSRGPVNYSVRKPDLLAPGVNIASMNALNPKAYAMQTGTSMSCPYVSGLAACIISEYPRLSPKGVKRLLRNLAVPMRGISIDIQGAGFL